MGGWPKDGDAKKCIDALEREFHWRYETADGRAAHVAGILYCSEASRDGCRVRVASTGQNTAKKVWQAAGRCAHGCAPTRRHW